MSLTKESCHVSTNSASCSIRGNLQIPVLSSRVIHGCVQGSLLAVLIACSQLSAQGSLLAVLRAYSWLCSEVTPYICCWLIWQAPYPLASLQAINRFSTEALEEWRQSPSTHLNLGLYKERRLSLFRWLMMHFVLFLNF